jgi:hypothetical protein
MKWRPGARTWWLCAAAGLLVFAAATFTAADPDLWGHVRFGLDALHTHRLTTADPYSFTQDEPWIDHEWLSEVLMAAVWTVGSAGLALLKGTLTFVVLWLIWRDLRNARLAVRVTVLVLVVVGTVHMWATLRPQLWTFVALALQCHALLAGDVRGRTWLPVLFVLWVNLHGGWIVGLAVLVLWAAGTVISRPGEWPGWALLVTGCAAATLCNPYGWHLHAFMLRTVHMTRLIREWSPLWEAPVLSWVPWGAAAGAALWAAARHERRWAVAGVLVMLGYAAVRVERIESLFVETAAILVAPMIVARWPARQTTVTSIGPQAERLLAASLAAVFLAASIWVLSHSLGCVPTLTSAAWAPDREAARLLSAAEPGRLVTYFDWGEYAIWHLGPRLRVSTDGRRETVYSDRQIALQDAIADGTAAGLSALATWRAEYVWLPQASSSTRKWLAGHGYRIDFSSDRSFVAVRADLPGPARPPSVSAPAEACFPR